MRGDQPVVSAASLIVRASIDRQGSATLTQLCQGWRGERQRGLRAAPGELPRRLLDAALALGALGVAHGLVGQTTALARGRANLARGSSASWSRPPVTVGWDARIPAPRSERQARSGSHGAGQSESDARLRRCADADRRARPSSRSSRPRASSSSSACPACTTSPLWEALRASPIRLVGVRHEQAAAYAADGYARATGRLGVALTTTGPGAANTLGAVGEAWASRSPVLVVATDIPTTLRRPGVYRGVLHETTDQAGDVRARGGGEPRRPRRRGARGARRRPPSVDPVRLRRPVVPGGADRSAGAAPEATAAAGRRRGDATEAGPVAAPPGSAADARATTRRRTRSSTPPSGR